MVVFKPKVVIFSVQKSSYETHEKIANQRYGLNKQGKVEDGVVVLPMIQAR